MIRRTQNVSADILRRQPLGRVVAMLALLCAFHGPSRAADPETPVPRPAWAATARVGASEIPVEHRVRYTFVLPGRHPFCLVEVPSALEDGGYAKQFGVRVGDRWLRNRLVRSGADSALLLIDATPGSGDETVEIYPLGRGDVPPELSPSSDEAPFRSPRPIACEFRKTRFPTESSDEDVLFGVEVAMLRRSKAQRSMADTIAKANENGVAAAQGNNGRRQGQNGPGDLLADLRTMLLVEEPGTYLFALKSPGAAAVLLGRDEDPVARCFRRFPAASRGEPATMPDEWTLGRELTLEPGVYAIHIASLTPFGSNAGVELGWLRPGATDIEPISPERFLTGQADLPAVRTEHRDTSIQVSFRTRLSPPYRFASTNIAFQLLTAVPRFDMWVSNDSDHSPQWKWLVDGRLAASAPSTLLSPLPAGPHEIALQIEYHGEVFASTQMVVVAGIPGKEYRIAAAPNGIEPILREDDTLRPDLWITGDDVGVDAELRVHMRDGSVHVVSNSVTPELQWARLEAPSLPVREAAGLSWTIRHGQVLLDEGSFDLVRPPFRDIPATIAGTTLQSADGRRLAFVVPSDEVAGQPPAATGGASPVVWITDLLFPGDAYLDDARVLRLASLRRDEGEGLSPVAPLCGLDAVPDGATAVMAIGLEDWIGRRTPEQLERLLVIMAGLLRDARGARVIVCTLPPLDGATEELRPYAAAALRAAKTAGVDPADLYSGFRNAPDPAALVDGIRLTPTGVRRAAEIVRRLLPSETPETQP